MRIELTGYPEEVSDTLDQFGKILMLRDVGAPRPAEGDRDQVVVSVEAERLTVSIGELMDFMAGRDGRGEAPEPGPAAV